MKKLLVFGLLFSTLVFAQKGRPQRSVIITAGGTGNAITGTPDPVLAAYSDLTATNPPMDVIFDATAANTGAVTINLNGIGAVAVVKLAGGVSTALVADDIRVKQPVILRYNATDNNFKLVSPTGNAPAGGGAAAYSHTWGCYRSGPAGLNWCDYSTAYSGGSTVFAGLFTSSTEASNLYGTLTNNATPQAGEKIGVKFRMPTITATSFVVTVGVVAQVTTTFDLTSKISCVSTNTAYGVTLGDTKTVTTTTPTVGRYYDLTFTHTAPGCTSGQHATVVISAVDTVNVGIAELTVTIQ